MINNKMIRKRRKK